MGAAVDSFNVDGARADIAGVHVLEGVDVAQDGRLPRLAPTNAHVTANNRLGPVAIGDACKNVAGAHHESLCRGIKNVVDDAAGLRNYAASRHVDEDTSFRHNVLAFDVAHNTSLDGSRAANE